MHPQRPAKTHPLHTPQPITRALNRYDILHHRTAPRAPSQLNFVIALRQHHLPDRIDPIQPPVLPTGNVVVEAEPRHVVPKQLCNVEVVAKRRQREIQQPLDGRGEYGRDLVIDE